MRLVTDDPSVPEGVLLYEILDVSTDSSSNRITEVREALERVIEFHPKILIDFSKIEFYGSDLFGILLVVYKISRTYSGKTVTCCMNPYGVEAMRICRIDTLIPYFETREDAYKFLLEEQYAVTEA